MSASEEKGGGRRHAHGEDAHALLVGLHRDHANTAALLKLLDYEIEQVGAGESPDYETMLDVMDYFINYPDLYHHPNEELLFARLSVRDDSAGNEVAALSKQHVELAVVGKALFDTIGRVLDDLFVDRAEFRDQAAAYSKMLHDHMLKEEGEVFPLATRVLSEADWQALDEEFAKRDDPLFGEIVAHRYVALAERLEELRAQGKYAQ